jgi:hypothetical protein
MKQIIAILIFVLIYGCGSPVEKKWRMLFNGKDLSGWETYLGPLYSVEKEDFDGPSVGLNKDPFRVFTVVTVDGNSALRISGQMFGGISTVDSFENYHLQLQFKWGEGRHKPRNKDKRDSGVLYHAHGKQGSEWFFWMKSQEFQVQEGDCGDYWPLQCEVDVKVIMNPDSSYRYAPAGTLTHFGSKSSVGTNIKKFPDDMEKPNGEWNTLDLYTFGQSSIHVVNGTVVMRLENSREIIDDKVVPLTKGKIQIQSEGAEVYYREIKIKSIDALPEI